MAEIAEDIGEALLALAVSTGLQVMDQLTGADVAAVCGPKGKHKGPKCPVTDGSTVLCDGRLDAPPRSQ